MFIDLGGVNRVDLNFSKQYNDGTGFECPVFVAAAKNDVQMMSLILQNATVDVNITDSQGINAFWLAAMLNQGRVMRPLAEKGIDVLCANDEGFNALHIACFNKDANIVKMLLESNYPIDIECKNGMTAF